MKKQTLASFGLSLVFMIAAICGTAAPALASNDDFSSRTIYEVPFDFYVGNEKMSAGKYEIHRVSDSAYQIRSVGNGESVIVPAQQITGDENRVRTAKLVFNRYGKESFLRAIYTQTLTSGRLIVESKTERRVKSERQSENNLAKTKPAVVEIAAQ